MKNREESIVRRKKYATIIKTLVGSKEQRHGN